MLAVDLHLLLVAPAANDGEDSGGPEQQSAGPEQLNVAIAAAWRAGGLTAGMLARRFGEDPRTTRKRLSGEKPLTPRHFRLVSAWAREAAFAVIRAA